MKYIDNLNTEELHRLINLIGYGVRPVTTAKMFFPGKPKGFLRVTRELRNYAYNKIVTLNSDLTWSTRSTYLGICIDIWTDLPEYARNLDFGEILNG